MHIGSWKDETIDTSQIKNSVPETAVARYQKGETCLGISGSGKDHLRGDKELIEKILGKDASQNDLHQAFNLLALGLNPVDILKVKAEIDAAAKAAGDEATDDTPGTASDDTNKSKFQERSPPSEYSGYYPGVADKKGQLDAQVSKLCDYIKNSPDNARKNSLIRGIRNELDGLIDPMALQGFNAVSNEGEELLDAAKLDTAKKALTEAIQKRYPDELNQLRLLIDDIPLNLTAFESGPNYLLHNYDRPEIDVMVDAEGNLEENKRKLEVNTRNQISQEHYEEIAKEKWEEALKKAQLRQKTGANSRTALDVSWSPPKSFSIVHAMTKNEELKKAMERMLEESVDETLAQMEGDAQRRVRGWKRNENGSIIKDAYGNKVRLDEDTHTGNMLYAKFMHTTNRPTELKYDEDLFDRLQKAGLKPRREGDNISIIDADDGHRKQYVRDMQLHMHTPIMNLTYDEDAKQWYPLQKNEMIKKMPYYQAIASQKLASKLEEAGFKIERAGKRWEIDSFARPSGREVIERFSKPTANVMKYKSEYNLINTDDRININKKIRQNKEEGVNDEETLQALWAAQFNELDMQELDAIYEDQEIGANKNYGYAERNQFPNRNKKGLSQAEKRKTLTEVSIDDMLDTEGFRSAAFNPQDIIAGAIHRGVTVPPEEIEAEFNKRVENGDIIERDHIGGERYCTTPELVQEEGKLTSLVTDMISDKSVRPSMEKEFKEATGEDGFTPGRFPEGEYTPSQLNTLDGVRNSQHQVIYVRGNAGTGKTTVGVQLAHSLRMSGKQIHPIAVYNPVRKQLKKDGYGEVLLTDLDGNMIPVWNEEEDRYQPKTLPLKTVRGKAGMEEDDEEQVVKEENGAKTARQYYKKLYAEAGIPIPKGIRNILEMRDIPQPRTVTSMLNAYEDYEANDEQRKRSRKRREKAEAFEEEMRGQVLFVDEAGQLGTVQAVKIMEMAKKLDMHVILVGDPKQHGSVTRGNVLDALEQYTPIKPHHMTDIRRQKGALRDICGHLADREYSIAFRRLDDDLNGVVALADPNERKEAFAQDAMESIKKGEEPMLIVPGHDSGGDINQRLREKLGALRDEDDPDKPYRLKTGKRKGQIPIDLEKEVPVTLLEKNYTNDADNNALMQASDLSDRNIIVRFNQNIKKTDTLDERYEGKWPDGTSKIIHAKKGAITRATIAKIEDIVTTTKRNEQGEEIKETHLILECKAKPNPKRYNISEGPIYRSIDLDTLLSINHSRLNSLRINKLCEHLASDEVSDEERKALTDSIKTLLGDALKDTLDLTQADDSKDLLAKPIKKLGADTKSKSEASTTNTVETFLDRLARQMGKKYPLEDYEIDDDNIRKKRDENSPITLYKENSDVKVAPGDRVVLDQSMMIGKKADMDLHDRRRQFLNGDSFMVKDIRQDKQGNNVIVLAYGANGEYILNPTMDPTHSHFSVRHYVSSYGAQSSTANRGPCMVYHEGKTTRKKGKGNLYTDLTRAAGNGTLGPDGKNNHLRVFTSSTEALIEDAKSHSNSYGALDVIYDLGNGINYHNIETSEKRKEIEEKLHHFGLDKLREMNRHINSRMKRPKADIIAITETVDPTQPKYKQKKLCNEDEQKRMLEVAGAPTMKRIKEVFDHQTQALYNLEILRKMVKEEIKRKEQREAEIVERHMQAEEQEKKFGHG